MAEILDISILSDISAFWPESEHIRNHIQSIETHLLANKPACLDGAKCLLESICKTIIQENGQTPAETSALNRHFADAMKCLGIMRSQATDIETELFNALVKSIEQVGRYRNHYSAGGHGRVANCEKLSDDMCMMAISTLLSGCLMIFREHRNQADAHTDVRFSLRPYESFAQYNDLVDENTVAEISAEEAEVILNGSRFRYSQILFALEREAYADIVASAGEAA